MPGVIKYVYQRYLWNERSFWYIYLEVLGNEYLELKRPYSQVKRNGNKPF
jgi:hypothetical protein